MAISQTILRMLWCIFAGASPWRLKFCHIAPLTPCDVGSGASLVVQKGSGGLADAIVDQVARYRAVQRYNHALLSYRVFFCILGVCFEQSVLSAIDQFLISCLIYRFAAMHWLNLRATLKEYLTLPFCL
jgi:hypothetical protein